MVPYKRATALNGVAAQEDLRLRFDVLTNTKRPEFHRYWSTLDQAANLRLFHLGACLSNHFLIGS